MVFSKKSLLCLKCRGTGHIARKCKQEFSNNFYQWFLSSERANFTTEDTRSCSTLCKRCSSLDLVQCLKQDIPWETSSERSEWPKYIRNLGKTGSIVFRQDCALCRCLFALTPTPESDDQDVLMCPSWNLNRLEGGVAMDTLEKRRSAKGILLTLASPDEEDFSKDSMLDRGDCLTILQEDLTDKDVALGGRRIAKTINLKLIQQWLAKCSDLHPITCTPMWSEELRTIRLVDVYSRRVVPHPRSPCAYIALSYVLGGVDQIVCKVGSLPAKLPRTIENSIELVRKLGIRYLWVDTLCIDQSESGEKQAQIRKMDLIYRGAYATIISLSGTSAESGLPRFGRKGQRTPQLSCRIGGKTLVTLMPTLSQQIFTCRWGTRAWTLQEALLSRRCIYLSDEQVYFECNAMQCCESIDESQSWVHNTYRDAEFLMNGHSEPTVGAGVLRSPFTGTSSPPNNNRLEIYGVLMNLYNYRYMTYQSDALDAFSGIVQYLQEVAYHRGFFWGLPLEDFNWALAWNSRQIPERRTGFPSWSWTGWDGWKWPGHVFDMRSSQKLPTFLRAFKLEGGELQILFTSEHKPLDGTPDCNSNEEQMQSMSESSLLTQADDPTLCAASSSLLPPTPSLKLDNFPLSLSTQLLVIEGITLTFLPSCSESLGYDEDGYAYWEQLFDIPTNLSDSQCQPSEGEENAHRNENANSFNSSSSQGTNINGSGDNDSAAATTVRCNLHAIAYDEELERLTALNQPHAFLLLGRQHQRGLVWFTLMSTKAWALDGRKDEEKEATDSEGQSQEERMNGESDCTRMDLDQEQVMTRGTVVHLVVPEEHVSGVMRVLRPEKRRVILA